MTQVLEARQAFEDARTEASATIARKRALLGLAMIQAREKGGESQASGPQFVRPCLGRWASAATGRWRAWCRRRRARGDTQMQGQTQTHRRTDRET